MPLHHAPGRARPSGATLEVVKYFQSAEDCAAQVSLMQAAGPSVALPIIWSEPNCFGMSLERPVTTSSFFDLMATYWDLWSLPSPRGPFARDDYHAYVIARPETDPVVASAKRLAADIYLGEVRKLPLKENVFTHGDAIVANAVQTNLGVRLIDFSPRVSPPERELDFSKLLFSAQGFDLDLAAADLLFKYLQRYIGAMTPKLLGYYLATHVVRVGSKEPPQTIARARTYERSLDYARQLAKSS